MAELKKTYASPGLRWGLYRHDHPACKDPYYEVVTCEHPDVNVPPQFAGDPDDDENDYTGLFILCTLDPCDGSEVVKGWKEVARWEQTRNGRKRVAQSPENWRKFCTQAMGRALKAAGYPDDTEDLKALLLWRQRSIELEKLAHGGPLALAVPPVADLKALDAAAKSTPHAEHPDVDDEPAEAEVVGSELIDRLPWTPEAEHDLKPIIARMNEEELGEFEVYADERGVTEYWAVSEPRKLKLLVAKATSLVHAAA